MLYRVRLDLAFDAEDVPRAIFDSAERVLSGAIKIASEDNPTGEVSFIEIHKCYHDETPYKPCEIIERIVL